MASHFGFSLFIHSKALPQRNLITTTTKLPSDVRHPKPYSEPAGLLFSVAPEQLHSQTCRRMSGVSDSSVSQPQYKAPNSQVLQSSQTLSFSSNNPSRLLSCQSSSCYKYLYINRNFLSEISHRQLAAMKPTSSSILAFAATLSSASAHMFMADPPALRSESNPFTTNPDYSITTPLGGMNKWPCKGYHTLLGTPQGTPVKTWTAGQTYTFSIQGGAPHGGGSCQASISTDGGNTFKVIHSYIGGCPSGSDSTFKFRLPADTPSSDGALFSWTWYNLLGNRELYADCAVVKIAGGSGGSESTPFSNRPEPFVANIGNGCTTADSKSVFFPNPGSNVDNVDSNAALPIGNCQAVVVVVGGGGERSGSGSGPSTQAPPPSPPTSGGDGGGYQDPAGEYEGSNGGQGSGSGGYGGSYTPGSQPTPNGQYPNTPPFTPGNDWPAGFQSGAESWAPEARLLVAVIAMVFAYLLA